MSACALGLWESAAIMVRLALRLRNNPEKDVHLESDPVALLVQWSTSIDSDC